jgi:hypothetical protein
MLSGVRVALGALVLNVMMMGAAFAAGCSAPDIVQDVPFFRDRMNLGTKGISTIIYVHKDDQRISASFQTATVAAPDPSVSRVSFAAEQQAKMHDSQASARARGATVAATVNPDDPVQWRIFYSNDASYGQDRLVGQYGIYVSATCLLTATISAPEGDQSAGDAFKRRWNDLVSAMEDVRASVARTGEPIHFAQEDLSPKGAKAYVIGLGIPCFATLVLFVLLNFFVTVGRPSMVSRSVVALAALSAIAALVANMVGWTTGQIPVEMLVLLGICGGVAAAGGALANRFPTLIATCIAGGTGFGLIGYAFFGWTNGQELCYAIGLALLLCAVVSALSWGSARTLTDSI